MSRWEKEVEAGHFESIPQPFRWSESARFAHRLDGYRLFGFEALASLANQKLAQAGSGGGWPGAATELWACLFFEHRRWRHAGRDPDSAQHAVLDDLCETLRRRLLGLDSEQRATLVANLSRNGRDDD